MNIFSRILRLLPTVLLLLSLSAVCAAQEKKKIAYGILLDNTGSMRFQFDTVLGIGKAVAQQIHDHGPVSVFDFASEGRGRGARAVPIVRIDRTQDQEQLKQTIDGLYVEGGQTALLDAVQFIAERLAENAAGPEFSDRVIILITDGEDRQSTVRQKQLVQKLSELKIRVFAIGLVQQLSSTSRPKAIDLLNDITKSSGGRSVFPKSDRPNLQSFLAELAIPIQ